MGVLSVSVPNVARLALPRLTLAEHGRRGFGDALRANLRAEAPNPSLVRLERPPREFANAGRVWAEVAALAPAPTMAEPLLLRRHGSSPGGVAFPGVAMVSTFGPTSLTPSQFEQVLAHELGHLAFWHRLGRHLSTPTQAVFNDLLSANIDEVVECFDRRFSESQLPTWFAVRRRAALAHPALVAEAPLERAVRFARIMRPYDELFADSVATLRAGRPLNITDFGYQPVKNDVRNFASTDTFSARELHLNYGALVHMRALLGATSCPTRARWRRNESCSNGSSARRRPKSKRFSRIVTRRSDPKSSTRMHRWAPTSCVD